MKTLNLREKILLSLTTVIVFYGLFDYFLATPWGKEERLLQEKSAQMDQQLQSLQKEMALLKGKPISTGERVVFKPSDLISTTPQIVSSVMARLTEHHLTLITLTYGKLSPVADTKFSKWNATLSVEGDYKAIGEFLFALQNSQFLVNVPKLKLTPAANLKLRRLDVEMEFYFLTP